MIKVLMCGSDRKEKGGMNSVIDQLLENEWVNDITLDYLATHISGNLLKKLLYFIRAYLKLIELLIKNRFDVVHIHMSYKGSFFRKYQIAKLCKRYNKRVIIHLHGSEFKDFFEQGNSILKRKIIRLFSSVDYTVVLGDSWREFIVDIAPKANVCIINNAVSIPEYKVREFNTTVTFLFLGALIKRKGIKDLLEASKRLLDDGIDKFKILIAGSGIEEENLKKYCEESNIVTKIEFLGWIDKKEKKELFEKSDVMILPSYNEGLPVAILEGIAYGLPIISTSVGSIKEAVIQDINGFVYDPGDVSSLRRNMEIMIEDREKRMEFSNNSRKIAEQKFSEKLFFDKIEKIYKN